MKEYVIITGAYGGLGKALARTYAYAGFALVLIGRKKDQLEAMGKELEAHTDILLIVADVGDWSACQQACVQIKNKKLNIKVLINNAGITYIKKFDTHYDIAAYKRLIDTNLNGPVFLSQLFLEELIQNRGSLINISSVLGYAPVIGRTAYAASKYGMQGFSDVLRAETKNKLHLMVVYPTFIQTDIRNSIEGDKTVNEVLLAGDVARSILKGQLKRKEKLYLGRTAKLSYYLFKYWPKLYVRIMRKKVGEIG